MNRYYVIRIKGIDECSICKEWEIEVNNNGGYPFGDEDVRNSENPDSQSHTNLFHKNCKCTLVLSPDGIPIKDDIDRHIIFKGALGHIYHKNKTPEERIKMVENNV